MLLRDKDIRSRLGELLAKPRRRVLEVERNVGTAGLENPQKRDDHVRRAIHAEPDGDVALDSARAQVMGEPVRPGVQLGIGQRLSCRGDDGSRTTDPSGLRLEATVHRRERGGRCGRHGRGEEASPLGRLRDREPRERLGGIGGRTREERDVAGRKVGRILLVEDGGVVVQGQPRHLAGDHALQEQWLARERWRGGPCRRRSLGGREADRHRVEKGRELRRRCMVLRARRVEDAAADLVDQLGERRLRLEARADRRGLGVGPDRAGEVWLNTAVEPVDDGQLGRA